MIRELFRIGPVAISPFGVMLMLAFLASYLQMRWGLRRLAAGDEEDASALLLAAGVGGVVGAKLYYAALYGDWHLFFDRSGLVWYGGFLLGTVAVLLTIRWRRLPAWPTADAGAVTVALGYALGRVGCFLVGDDYGVPTDAPWGVRFPEGLPPTTAGALRTRFDVDVPPQVPDHQLLAVHPTQLYETVICLLVWVLGLRMLKRRGGDGTTALAVLSLLTMERFFIEFLRAKDDRLLGPFTVAQLIAAGVLVALLWIWSARRRRPRPA